MLDWSKFRYLVVEDTPVMRVWLRQAIINMGGKSVTEATSYGDAIYRLNNHESFDIVLCDYILSQDRYMTMPGGQRVLAKACMTCRGSGAVRKAALFGWLWNEQSCADCGGDGRHRESCGSCGGSGEQTVAYRRRVRIPAGVRDGHILSVPALRHGETEIDLELEVMIEPHPLFKLDGDGLLRCEVPVNGFAWMAGRWVEVPTPNGMQQMRLNRNAMTYRLSGQGFPTTLRGPRGDYLVKVVPAFPAQEDPEQEELLERLIAKSNEALKADRSQPLGQWQRRLKRWNVKQKEPARNA